MTELSRDAQEYLDSWRRKGYTGDYIPLALREQAERPVSADVAERAAEEATVEEPWMPTEEDLAALAEWEQVLTSQSEQGAAKQRWRTAFVVYVDQDGNTAVFYGLPDWDDVIVENPPGPEDVRMAAHKIVDHFIAQKAADHAVARLSNAIGSV